MKNIKKSISGIALIACMMMSCGKDFIALDPVSSVSIDVLYKTDKDFIDALTATYNTMQDQYKTMYIFGDIHADDSWQEIIKNNGQSYSETFVTTSSDDLMNSTWGNYYKMIFRVNMILSRIEVADASVIVNKERYTGEAKFLRALAYFDLVRIFGNVPLVTKPLSIDEGYKMSREDVAKIYDEVIIPDLLAAEKALPAKYTGADVGRATQGAAKSLLGKVYLTRGDFVNAEAKLKEVTTMGYALLPKFNDLFDYTKDEHHSEYIFDVEYVEGISEGSNFTHAFLPNYAPLLSMYKIIGNGDEQNSPTQILMDLYEPKDQRKDITVGVKGGYYNADSVFVKLPANTSQTFTKKYIISTAISNDSRANWKVIRYADVLLMYAEALNENGKTTEALTYLNQVRTRAGLAGFTGLNKDQTRDKVILERRLELSFEGHRWFDLLRIGKAYETMKSRGMLPYMTVFPLPLSQTQLINDPSIFPQNTGYN